MPCPPPLQRAHEGSVLWFREFEEKRPVEKREKSVQTKRTECFKYTPSSVFDATYVSLQQVRAEGTTERELSLDLPWCNGVEIAPRRRRGWPQQNCLLNDSRTRRRQDLYEKTFHIKFFIIISQKLSSSWWCQRRNDEKEGP